MQIGKYVTTHTVEEPQIEVAQPETLPKEIGASPEPEKVLVPA